jgi:hypothetical protein
MGVGKKTEQMLFILGRFLSETDRRFKHAPLRISVSKVEFITTIEKLGIVKKKERAVYRNLEILEKKKYIAYKKKNLSLTRKGYNNYKKMADSADWYSKIINELKTKKILKITRKIQTILKSQ